MGYLDQVASGWKSGQLLNGPRLLAREALLRALHPNMLAPRLRAKGRLRQTGGIKRILVIRPDHLGDLLFATPALDLLRETFPEAHIAGLVGPWGRAMWQDNPNLDTLETLPFPGIAAKEGGPLAPYMLLRKAAANLRRDNYDMGVVLRFDHWWGAALLCAAGVPHRWGYDIPDMAAWLTNAVPYKPGRHEVEQNLQLVESLSCSLAGKGTARQVELPIIGRQNGQPPLKSPQPAAPNPAMLGNWLQSPHRAIIHPGTAAANKLWTVQGWAEVARHMVEHGWSVALTGSPDEQRLAQAIVAAYNVGAPQNTPPLLNLAGKTASIQELVWVLAQAHMVLGVDSGPLHIADALHKPSLHLYGPSDETIWGPWGDPNKHRAFRAPGTCPTMRLDVGSPEIEGGPDMKAISVAMVMGEIEQLIRNS